MNDRLDTNLNTSPYYDDFDSSKNYVRILFRPAKSVQVRELNQLQTVLQNQTARFADNIFKDGTIVDGGRITYKPKQPLVRVADAYDSANVDQLTVNNIDSYLLYANTGVRAVVQKGVRGFASQYPNTNLMYIDYIRTGKDGSNNDISVFQGGETLYIYNTDQDKLGTLDANNLLDSISTITSNATQNAIGEGYLASIGEGVVYQKGFFTEIAPQTVVVKSFDQNLTGYALGFSSTETLISEDQDSTLLDNSNGTYNQNAPGAHRLKITPTLVSVDLSTLDSNTVFLPIIEFDDDRPVEDHTSTIYNKIGDVLNLRTSEESGDYVIKPFSVESLEHSSNTSKLQYSVSPGIAYVNGSRVELIGTKTVETDRAIQTAEAQAQIISASYGNYVIVDEVVGMFNTTVIDTVDIYDTAQDAVSDVDGAGSAPSGNSIGTASIRAFEYNNGSPGLANATYRAYIFNIQMDSGFSFKNDAKSFFANNTILGPAKADIVLQSSKAIINDSTDKNILVFDTGLESIRRLRDSLGVNDTQYIFYDTANATLQTNGFITFTINSPLAGGTDRLNASAGALTETLEDSGFMVVLSDEAYSANLTGTITASGNVVTGSGTDFENELNAGQYIRADGNTRRVTAVTNSTQIEIASSLTVSANVFQRYWPQGTILSNEQDAIEINILSNTQFTVSTNMGTLDSGTQTAYGQYPILRTQAVAKSKDINKSRYVKINPNTNAGGLTGPWNLGLVDVNQIEAVYYGTSYSASNPDRKDWFTLDTGQRANKYDHASLSVKPNKTAKIDATTLLLVKLNHFTANTSAGSGFFAADSYPLIDQGDTANSTNIAIEDVVTFEGYDMRNVVDFRPQLYNTANSSTTVGNATVNPSAANGEFNIDTKALIVSPDTNFQADIEFYLPRYDVISITPGGTIIVKNGQPDTNPKIPFIDADAMVIAEAYVPAYPSLTTRETDTNNRDDLASNITRKTNRGYTMRDIGVLDKRIERLEYYVTLNTLEQAAKDLTVTDNSGLDRFKNGIFANPFNSHALSAVNDIEYNIAVDNQKSIARPLFDQHNIDYDYKSANSSNITRSGKTLSLPFTSELMIEQQFASKYRNCTESQWKWNGRLKLYPNYDHFKDVINKPANMTNIVIGPTNAPQTVFGDWRVIDSEVIDVDRNRRRRRRGGTTTTTTTTTTTVENTSVRSGTEFNIVTTSDTYSIGNYVTDVNLLPYMRSRLVAFYATGLKPNSDVYPFFDEVAVATHCAPGSLSELANVDSEIEHEFVTVTGAFGAQLRTDDDGTVAGKFRIPEASFRNGERLFVLCDVDDLATGSDAILTMATAKYTAQSIQITKQESKLQVDNNEIESQEVTQVDRVTTTNVRRQEERISRARREGLVGNDPIAQSFLSVSKEAETGYFLDKIGVYFKSKDSDLGVTCVVVEMDGGEPNSNKIIASKHIEAASVNVSDTAATETVFDFDGLYFLENGKFYAFYIKPDGDSPNYQIWTAEVGGEDVTTAEQIFMNPYVGVMYVSANMNAHTPIQTEDLKFKIYRSKFTQTSGTAVFKSQAEEYVTIDGLNKANSSISVQVGDVVYTQDGNGDVLTSNSDPVGYIQWVDEGNDQIVIENSSGGFAANDVLQIHREYFNDEVSINANTLIANCTIQSLDDLQYSIIVPRFGSFQPAGTTVSLTHKGMDSGYTQDTTAYRVVPETDNEKFDQLRVLPSYSNETTPGSEISITLTSNSNYLSPVLSLRRKNSILVENLINNSSNNEHTKYGEAISKYISPTVTLAEGQDAEDIKVFVSGYKPSGTTIEAYVKFKNASDEETFDEKVWTKLTTDNSRNSSTANPEDYIEIEYYVPSAEGESETAYLNANNSSIIEYKDGSDAVYVGFKQFAIKLVLLSGDKVIVPRIDDVRAIALQI